MKIIKESQSGSCFSKYLRQANFSHLFARPEASCSAELDRLDPRLSCSLEATSIQNKHQLLRPFLHQTIRMQTRQSKLMNPSSSMTSTPCSAQAPTSIKDSLPRYGISIEQAENLNREYNYTRLPRIHEDKFWALLIEVASDANPADVEFESKVESVMEQRNNLSRAKFEEQAYEIMLPGARLFQDQSQKSDFLSALDEQHTIHSYEAFFANCLPLLVKELQQRQPKQRQPSSINHTRNNSVSQRVSKSSSESIGQMSRQRSPRSKKQDTSPSE